MTMKRALLIGVDHYDNFSDLTGCANDIDAVEPLLARSEDGSPNFDCQKRTSVTGGTRRDSLLADFEVLLRGGADVALCYFAGHGHGTGSDVALVTEDGTGGTPGITLSEIVTRITESSVGEVILILDCCFAGAAAGVPQLGTTAALLRNGVSILAASRADQTAAETGAGRGLFSTYVCGGLEGGAADVLGKISVAGLYSYLDESFGPWDQRPVFKANVERLHELRGCRPAVPLPELRLLTTLFPTAAHEFPLDPSYEPDANPRNEDHERAFGTLQKYRAAKLLEPVGEEHMYFAAMNSRGCKLTPLGMHYRHLAEEGRL
jgi:Caspase domain